MMCLYLLRDRNQSTSLWCHFLPLWPVCLSVCLPSLCVFHHPCLSIVWVRVCACLNAAALVNLFLPMSVSSPSVPNNGLCSLFCWTTQKASHGERMRVTLQKFLAVLQWISSRLELTQAENTHYWAITKCFFPDMTLIIYTWRHIHYSWVEEDYILSLQLCILRL